ncbi:hypothetical protein Q8F55_007643 [Vanrija albida]|uniref:Proteophosphoglycan ppg4 n=1 Tax=Vanrija albida TaxID=181172 RepID=A0ABR3PUE3_9TREE
MSPEPPGPPSPPSPSGFLALRSPSPPSPAESSDPTSSPESSVHHHLQLPGEPSLVSVVTTAESIPNPSIETIPRPSSANGLVRALDPRKTPLTISRLFSGSRLKKKSRSPTPPSTNASASYLASASASASASTTAFTSASSIPSLRLSDLASESTTVEEPDSASPPSSPVSPTSTTNAGLNLFAPKPTAFRGVPLTPAGARAQAKRHSLEIVPRRPSSQASDRERERQRPLTFPASSPTTPSAPKPTVIHKSAPPSPTRPRSSADLTRRASSPTPPARPSSPLRLGRGFNIFSSMWESRNATLLPAIPSRPSSVATADEYASGAPIQHAIRNSGTFGITDDGSEIFSLIGFEHLQRRRTSSGSIIEVTQVRRSLYAENADPAEAAESVEMLAGGGEERAHAEETRSAQSSAHTFGFRSPALVTPDSERSEAERGLRLQVHPHPHDHPHGHHLHGHPHAHHLHGHPHAHQLHGHPHMHFPAEAMATENHNGHANGYPDLHTPASATLAASPTAHGASAALRAAAVMMAAHAGALVTNAGCAGDGQETLRRMAAESARFSTILEAMATSADFERDFESSGAAGHEHDTGSRVSADSVTLLTRSYRVLAGLASRP